MSSPLKQFRINTAFRVAFLGLTVLGGFAVYFWTGSFLASGILGTAALYQLWALVYYVQKTNRDLARLLESIRYSDFSQGFTSDQRGQSFAELSGALKGVVDDFKTARREKEESFRYLQTVMQHVGVGLISFERGGRVSLINSAAKKLLGVPYLKHIDRLEEVTPRLVDTLKRLRNGDKTLVKIVHDGETLDLSIYATEFKLGGDMYKLVSLQNIRSELEDTEVAAWQKLTRVLAHEIMNSVAPIASLASTADNLLADVEPRGDGASEELSDIRGAIATIARRSEGLLSFVESYRRVTRVPDPERTRFLVRDLCDQVDVLMRSRLDAAGIGFEFRIEPPSLELDADRDQIEQVLINLVRNAAEASDTDGRTTNISIRSRIDSRGHVLIEVSDDGPGVPEDVLERMFVPFFTTKKDGSGIGLSLSREIMRRHGGSLSADSSESGATFTLRF